MLLLTVSYSPPHTSDGTFECTLCSQWCISSPLLCHTLNGTVGMLSAAGGSCRAALGLINFIAYFYYPPLCMQPPSHPSASALTVHTAVKFCVSPCFMVAWFSSCTRFLYLLLKLFHILPDNCAYLVSYLLWLMELSAFQKSDTGKMGLCYVKICAERFAVLAGIINLCMPDSFFLFHFSYSKFPSYTTGRKMQLLVMYLFYIHRQKLCLFQRSTIFMDCGKMKTCSFVWSNVAVWPVYNPTSLK